MKTIIVNLRMRKPEIMESLLASVRGRLADDYEGVTVSVLAFESQLDDAVRPIGFGEIAAETRDDVYDTIAAAEQSVLDRELAK